MSQHAPTTARRRRALPLLWVSGVAAAILLVLGVNGTLSGWASAVIGNPNNSVAAATSVALTETGGDGTNLSSCDTATSTDNTATCSMVNKYGGVAGGGAETTATGVTPLAPGDSRSATVTLANDGTGTGNLVLSTDACSSAINDATGGYNAAYDVCSQITVAVSCIGDANASLAATPLSAFNGLTIGDLAPTKSTACTFTVKLPDTTPSGYSNQLATQALTWTLTAA